LRIESATIDLRGLSSDAGAAGAGAATASGTAATSGYDMRVSLFITRLKNSIVRFIWSLIRYYPYQKMRLGTDESISSGSCSSPARATARGAGAGAA